VHHPGKSRTLPTSHAPVKDIGAPSDAILALKRGYIGIVLSSVLPQQDQRRTNAMAKGQMKSNKEKKKPKAEWNKKKKGAAPAAGQAPAKPGHNPFGKKD
jgi:hypothetical protein